MIRLSATLILAAAVTLGAAADYRLREETILTHTLRFGGNGERLLDVRNLHGSITVTGTSGDAVELRARRTVAADSAENLRRGEQEAVLTVRDGQRAIDVVVREPDSPTCGEKWEGSWQRRPRYHVTYDMTISVPARTALRLCTINGRSISVSGTTGDFEVDNVNGQVTLTDVRGSGSARTVNGRVKALLLEAPRRDGEFRSVNGEVAVTWPGSLAARLRLKTFNGGLFTDYPFTPVEGARPVPERRDGMFVYRSSQFTELQVGRGGPTITLESFNGNVRVLSAGR